MGYDQRSARDDRGGGSGGGRPSAGSGRPGDWLCPSCNNNNFAYRHECNRCRTQKPVGSGGDSGGSHNGGRYQEDAPRSGGHYGARGGSSNYRHNDLRDRGSGGGSRDRNRERSDRDYGDRDRDRDRDRGDRERDRDRNRGGYNSSSSGGGPSRNHMRGKDDRRSRPY